MDFEAHDRAIISDLEADLSAARAEIERLTKERDEALAAEAEYRRKNHALTNERDANAKWLGELLAVIHRDGGHYQSQHGDEKAVDEAHMIVARLLTERDEARAQVAARDDIIGSWLSAALEDPNAGPEFKADVQRWFETGHHEALEAYGRERWRDGMKRAAALGNELPDVMWDQPWSEYEYGIANLQSAILAEMEKLK